MHRISVIAAVLALVASSAHAKGDGGVASAPLPLAIGETFVVESKALGEARRINVYRPPFWGDTADAARPVLYMPDGGVAEDFLHVAGLMQVCVGNGTMRPFLLVGIENTERRRDLTGPTRNAEDRRIAPRVGGSAAFRAFLRTELMPVVASRHRTTGETAIMGESLAGLFVVETLFAEPDLFDTYIAFDPSLWWNDSSLVSGGRESLASPVVAKKTLYLASSDEPTLARLSRALDRALQAAAPPGFRWTYVPMPGESHATLYHPAALAAFRKLFAPAAGTR